MPRRAVAKHAAVKRPAVAKHVVKRLSRPSPSSNIPVVLEVTHEGPAWDYERMQKEEHVNHSLVWLVRRSPTACTLGFGP